MNLMSSTLLTEDTGVPFHSLQAEQVQRFLDAWKTAGYEHEPRVSVSRSIFPVVSDMDRAYFGDAAGSERTKLVTWTAAWPDSARPTPGSRISSSRNSPRTRQSRRRTHFYSRFRISSASTSTPTSLRVCCATSRRSLAGAEFLQAG